MIIAVDGPAASGKGTLSQRLAAHFGLRYLDTGLTYRAVAAALRDGSLPLDQEDIAVAAAQAVDLSNLDPVRLGDHQTGETASRIAVLPLVRRVLVERQREFALRGAGAVLDGRDIGTVVFPDAQIKLFVTASPEARARRRTRELISRGIEADYEAIVADLRRRDERDASRLVAPLRRAPDAVKLDTTDLGIEEAFRAAVDIVQSAQKA